MYQCPWLHFAIEECFDNDENSIADIACYLKDFDFKHLLSPRIFSTRVGENKEHCLFTCETHLKTILLGMRKIVCTSVENDETVSIEYSDKKEVYCIDCVKHYMKLMYPFFCSFLIFHLVFFFKKQKNGACIQLL